MHKTMREIELEGSRVRLLDGRHPVQNSALPEPQPDYLAFGGPGAGLEASLRQLDLEFEQELEQELLLQLGLS